MKNASSTEGVKKRRPKSVMGWCGVITNKRNKPILDLEPYEDYGLVYMTRKAAASRYQCVVRVKVFVL